MDARGAGRVDAMVTLLLDSTQLEVVLSPTERALAFRKNNIVLPPDPIAPVQLTDDPWTLSLGLTNPRPPHPVTAPRGKWKYRGV